MDRKLRQTKIKYQNDIAPEWSSSNYNPPWNADSTQLTELFHGGFQTIRSLEKDVFITHLATPNFATYAQSMMKKETKTTTDELRLVKENLEKLLLNCDGKSRRGSTYTEKAFNFVVALYIQGKIGGGGRHSVV
uniref:uncharacterized protein LOC122595289 n=1 Tax=Erigeron canadensis TaxID=72917 RepID=UPI001CB930A7|nr:uncharacterized protein LOC122595289 [Erigeron canadensis]